MTMICDRLWTNARLATMAGFVLAAASLLVAIVFLCLKLAFWDRFPAGNAPAVIGVSVSQISLLINF